MNNIKHIYIFTNQTFIREIIKQFVICINIRNHPIEIFIQRRDKNSHFRELNAYYFMFRKIQFSRSKNYKKKI